MISFVRQSNLLTFGIGVIGGAALELIKIHLSVRGISFYQTFNKNQLERELASFEKELIERHEFLLRHQGSSSKSENSK